MNSNKITVPATYTKKRTLLWSLLKLFLTDSYLQVQNQHKYTQIAAASDLSLQQETASQI